LEQGSKRANTAQPREHPPELEDEPGPILSATWGDEKREEYSSPDQKEARLKEELLHKRHRTLQEQPKEGEEHNWGARELFFGNSKKRGHRDTQSPRQKRVQTEARKRWQGFPRHSFWRSGCKGGSLGKKTSRRKTFKRQSWKGKSACRQESPKTPELILGTQTWVGGPQCKQNAEGKGESTVNTGGKTNSLKKRKIKKGRGTSQTKKRMEKGVNQRATPTKNNMSGKTDVCEAKSGREKDQRHGGMGW